VSLNAESALDAFLQPAFATGLHITGVAPLARTSDANFFNVSLNSTSSTNLFLLASLMPNWIIT
jgi:hypothetical protein